jgi:quercetin dioxygenase-like cupin family protein
MKESITKIEPEMELSPAEISELAVLAALDALDPRDATVIESYAATSAQLHQELLSLRQTVASLPYSSPLLSPPPQLKSRLFEQIELEESQSKAAEFVALRSPEITWYPHFIKGIKIAILHTDTQKRELSCLVRCEPGAKYPLHRHSGHEEIFMLEGDLQVEGKVYGAGDYLVSAPYSAHAPETEKGCMFFTHTSIDDEYFGFYNKLAHSVAKKAMGF